MAGPHRLLLVDINVLGFGAMREWAYVNRSCNGQATGAIHGTLDKLFGLLTGRPDHVPVVLWDDRCHWREQILPHYKRHRWATPDQQAMLESYLAQAAVVRELVRHLGIAQIFCPGYWRLGPALPAEHELLFGAPQPEEYDRACVAWGLTEQHREAGRRGTAGADATAAVAAIASILEAESARNSG